MTAVTISSTAIRVSWDPVPLINQNGVITQYEVEYNQTTFSEVSMYNTTTVNSTTLMVDLTGLEEDVVYFIRVRAYTSVGAGPYSNVVVETTQEYCMYYLFLIEYHLKISHVIFHSSACFTSGQCNGCQHLFNFSSSVLGPSPCH